jgi:hypothetical protein
LASLTAAATVVNDSVVLAALCDESSAGVRMVTSVEFVSLCGIEDAAAVSAIELAVLLSEVPDELFVSLLAAGFAICVLVSISCCNVRLKLSAVEEESAAPLMLTGTTADIVSARPIFAACIWPCLSTPRAKHFSGQSFACEILRN